MIITRGMPFKDKEKDALICFLNQMNLSYDESIEYSICILNDNYDIIATGSIDLNVIKCVAVDEKYQGQGLSATIISDLTAYAIDHMRTHLMIYTKPKNEDMFSDMGFYTILKTKEILFMENRKNGYEWFIKGLRSQPNAVADGIHGCIIANCNPMTKGHAYLIESALQQCDYLHLFVLSDKRSEFTPKQRFEMVKAYVSDHDRVILHQTSDYMISAATFPTYFMKDQESAKHANCMLDIELFGKKIAPALHITKRFVGTEPYCQVTAAYNKALKEVLPGFSIELIEIQRKMYDDVPISASNIRKLLQIKEYEKIKAMVPEVVYAYLQECYMHS